VRRIEPWVLESKPNTTLETLEKSYLAALASVDALETHMATAVKLGTLTPSGIAADSLQFAASTLAPALKKARNAVEQAKHEAAARRAKLVLKPADKSDAAGQARRLWKLDKFNALPDAERNQYLAKAGDRLDPELAQAFLEAPEYAKLLPGDLNAIAERTLRQQHGEAAFDELRDLEAGIAIAEDTITAAREEVASEVGGLAKLDEAAKPYEKLLGAAWLRKFSEGGSEVVKSFQVNGRSGTWRMATEEEIENGMFFNDANEWRAAAEGVVLHSIKEHVNGG
jgi:hypothetical protein